MSDLSSKFKALKKENRCAIMPYVSVGDPDADTSVRIINTLVDSGADVIELGLPFSDPIADGPTIQKASQRSLSSGMNTDVFFKTCRRVKKKDTVLIVMTYYNLILQYGLDRFAERCRETGISGIIAADLPVEESEILLKSCSKYWLDLIFLVAQTTTDARLDRILQKAGGFIYLVSLLGVTGARDKMNPRLRELVARVKRKTDLPICVGFGVSKPEHVKELASYGVDGVIVGSALIRFIERNLGDAGRMLIQIRDYLSKLKKESIKAADSSCF